MAYITLIGFTWLVLASSYGIRPHELGSLHTHLRGQVNQRQPKTLKHRRNTQLVFENIYDTQLWGAGGNGSGSGSEESSTRATSAILMDVVADYNVKSIVDAPCGGMKWMPRTLELLELGIPGLRYLGVDIVRSVIDSNSATLTRAHPLWIFRVFDFTQALLPAGYDLVFCRDALQHLPYQLIINALENFSGSAAKLLLVGSYAGANHDLKEPGEYFKIDLLMPPFSLPSPTRFYNEHTSKVSPEADKLLMLYKINEMRELNFTAMRERAGIL